MTIAAAAVSMTAAAQPAITGALNTASYIVRGLPNSGLAQGSMIAIFGRNIGPAAIAQAGSFPLPTTLGGSSARITAAGQNFDLFLTYSIATQIGAIIPSNVPVGNATLTVSFGGQTSTSIPVEIVQSQLGIFTINQAGSGPAVVQNVNSETDRPINTILASARPNQAMILWGTGLGPIQGSDAQSPPVGDLNQPIEVLVGGRRANVLYKGRSGCCAAIDQIVFEVPGGVSGCYVPLVVKNGNRVSNYTSIAVAPTGGRCSDPFGFTAAELSAIEASGRIRFGSVNLTRLASKINLMGIALDSTTDAGDAAFIEFNQQQILASRGPGGNAVTVGACTLFTYSGASTSSIDPILPRVLDAGPSIMIAGPKGSKPVAKGQGGYYSSVFANATSSSGIPGLPPGFPGPPVGSDAPYLDAGSYTATGPGGADVGSFSSQLNVPGNFRWTNEASITDINRANDLPITWTGAGGNDYVSISGGSSDTTARAGASFVCLERGSAGQLTVPSAILLGLPASIAGNLSVGITTEPVRFNATGIDFGTFSYNSMQGKTVTVR
jgi:uncharacterized protein (TIGR03437 family)